MKKYITLTDPEIIEELEFIRQVYGLIVSTEIIKLGIEQIKKQKDFKKKKEMILKKFKSMDI